MDATNTIGAAEFKAHCLEILDRLSTRELSRVTITKRGRPVAVLVPPVVAEPWWEERLGESPLAVLVA
jgi:prevent-host-death family protein